MVLNIFIEHEHLCIDAVCHSSGSMDCSYFLEQYVRRKKYMKQGRMIRKKNRDGTVDNIVRYKKMMIFLKTSLSWRSLRWCPSTRSVIVKTTVENKKRMHILFVSDFVHIILYEEDFVRKVTLKTLEKY